MSLSSCAASNIVKKRNHQKVAVSSRSYRCDQISCHVVMIPGNQLWSTKAALKPMPAIRWLREMMIWTRWSGDLVAAECRSRRVGAAVSEPPRVAPGEICSIVHLQGGGGTPL